METPHALARDAQTISRSLAALIEWLSAYVEQRPAEMLTHQFAAPRREGTQPPAPPNVTGIASVASYHTAMLRWLGEIRHALRRIPAGATAVALAGAAAGDVDLSQGDKALQVWAAMSIAELVMYVNNVDEAARLLAFYCAFLESM